MILNLKEAKSVKIKRFVKELKKDVIINVDLSVIDFQWESLLYSSNNENFATVICGDFILELVTNGEVKIVDTKEGITYTNGNLTYEIISKIKNGTIYEDDRYVIDNNNWFAVVFGNRMKKEGDTFQYQSIDDVVFESTPENIDELIDILIELTVYFVEQEKSRDNVKTYVGRCDDVEIIVEYAILNNNKYTVTHIDEEIIGLDNSLVSAIFERVLIIKDYYNNFRREASYGDEDVDSTSLEVREFIDSSCINKLEIYIHAYGPNGEKLITRTIKLEEELPF